MNYQEAVEFLYKLQQFGANFGLERAFLLAEIAGRPQDKLKFIHVAGTNGKGSTCAMLESVYRHAGYKTGLFTSPHLISFAERIQVNRQLIPEPEVARLVSEMRGILDLKQLPEIDHPTFFEVVTIMALKWFAEQKCDIVIWETGLGGRLDATNIVTPLASVITNIQFDHEKWLGHTLAEIAREKAGIIKPGVPVFTSVESDEAFQVIKAIAEEKAAPLYRTGNSNWKLGTLNAINLLGSHQRKNAALALETVVGIHPMLYALFTDSALANIQWPGRFDIRGRYILDGAHNPAGAQTLRQTLEQTFPGLKPTFIVGILADKDIAAMAREFAPVASRILTVSVHSDRAADAQLIADRFRAVAPTLPIEPCASFAEAIQKSEDDDRVVITGSLHFIGEAMEFLGFEVGQRGERALNDWSQKKDAR